MKPKALLSARGQIDCVDSGLSSVTIIAKITSRRVVTKLVLSHNELSDDGCIVLFTFLSSTLGRKYRIPEISLNSNAVGDRGLGAISSYLIGNVYLKELYLQNNNFTANSEVVLSFTRALNRSKLGILSLTTNHSLSDDFTQLFFPALDCSHLGELNLSATGITHHSVPFIVDFLTSPRCRLHTLRLNGNIIGFRGVRKIISAIESRNFTLLNLEMHANQLAGAQGSDDTSGEDDNDSVVTQEAWKDSDSLLKRILTRNSHLKRAVEKEALELLVFSRVLLLRSSKGPQRVGRSIQPRSDSCSCISDSSHSPSSNTDRSGDILPFTAFPTELQLQILSLLAPTLSPRQRFNIFAYASSPSTLPSLLPCLSSISSKTKVCIPDPTNSMMDTTGGIGPEDAEIGVGVDPRPGSTFKRPVWSLSNAPKHNGCASGKCMGNAGSVLCHRLQERMKWLEEVNCTAYDPTFHVPLDT
ncbi:RNI-like protein [Marasmius fiardii PR-910]|nr:RNI-like protein [Marasmius fiardii PR-910]